MAHFLLLFHSQRISDVPFVAPYEGEEIDPPKLEAELRKEAPFFMRQLMAFDLSGVCGRHTLPVLMTKEKAPR